MHDKHRKLVARQLILQTYLDPEELCRVGFLGKLFTLVFGTFIITTYQKIGQSKKAIAVPVYVRHKRQLP